MNVINSQENFLIKLLPSEYSIICEILNAGISKTREDYYNLHQLIKIAKDNSIKNLYIKQLVITAENLAAIEILIDIIFDSLKNHSQ